MERAEFTVHSVRVAPSDRMGDDAFIMAESPFRLAVKLDQYLAELTRGLSEGEMYPRPAAVSVVPIRVELN